MAPPTTISLPDITPLTWKVRTPYTTRTIITYNLSLGTPGTSLSLTYEAHPNFHALPTFATLPVIAAMSAVTKSMPDFLPGFRPERHVHGAHKLRVSRTFPVPEGAGEVVLETVARVVGVVARRKGVEVIVGMTTTEGEREVCYNEWTSYILGVPTAGASSAPEEGGRQAWPERPPDQVREHLTSPEQAALYRAATGDLNPLHIDPEVAKRGGFPGPILTGTCTMGIGVRHVLEAFAEGEVGRFRGCEVRLSAPVFPGEVVRTEMWGMGEGWVRYRQCVGEKVVMKDCLVELGGREEARL